MPNLNMNNFQTRNRTFDPDPLPYLGNIWNNPKSYKIKNAGKLLYQRLNDQYIQNWSNKQLNIPFGSKLHELKNMYTYSTYLDKIYNIEIRKYFTKLRIGHNILNSSMGQFKSKNKNGHTNANRLCTNCDKLETIEHFLFVCPK